MHLKTKHVLVAAGAVVCLLTASGCSSSGGTPTPTGDPTETPAVTSTATPENTTTATPEGSPSQEVTSTPESTPTSTPAGSPSPTPRPPKEPSPEAIAACDGLTPGAPCQFTAPDGPKAGTCQLSNDVLACSPGGQPQGEFDMSQTLSDGAQRQTIAFDGLGMVTGNLEAQSFFPPGKVADYWGFQYLRDNDPDNMGHNTDFLTRIANNVLYILNDTQLTLFKELAGEQVDQINQYGYERYPLMDAFRRGLTGDLPPGTSGLSLSAINLASRALYRLDGQMSFDRAVVYAHIYRTLDDGQRAYLDAMVGVGFNGWPDIPDEAVKEITKGLPHDEAVAVMTYAGDLFSWYAGSLEADVYFCPERQGTYYGSFYMKDAPAKGHEGYSIDEQMTAEAGQAFLDELAKTNLDHLVTDLVDVQRDNLYASSAANIVQVREDISSLLRSLIVPEEPSETVKATVLEQVLKKSEVYGELDGEINYWYATAFAEVSQSLNQSQRDNLMALRQSIMSGTYEDGTDFDFSVCTTYFLYSEEIKDPSVLDPYISDTDGLFE